jgi:tRNA(Ile)-lysidine synthase
VESYLAGRGLSWREDASNSDMGFLRNRVRAKLVPLLEGEFPGWKRGLGALGETQSLAADFIAKEARNRLPWEWVETRRGRELRTGGFFDEPRIIREEALFQGLNLFHPPSAPGRRNLRRFARGEIRDLDLGFCRIAAGPEGAAIFRPPEAGGFSLLIKGPGLYKLEGIGAGLHYGAARAGKPVLKVWEGGESPGGQGFFAALPLLLRCPGEFGRLSFKDLKGPAASGTRTVPPFCFQNIALAQDAAGPAALIGLSPAVVLWKREGSSGDSFFCGIGGIDA